MNMKYPMALFGTLLVLSGCTPSDNKPDSTSAVTNEMKDASKNLPPSSVTNIPPATTTNQAEPAPK